jgi:phosphoglycolate phosphatase-like HAD superfamily hydrolase
MKDYNKSSEYLICVDNDGTVMDTMLLKHKFAIAPAFFETYKVQDFDGKKMDHWLKTNLFTKNRGVNRFLALDEMIDYLGIGSVDQEDYKTWLKNTNHMSISSLKEELDKKTNSISLNLAYKWSMLVNDYLSNLEKPQIFNNAYDVLKKYHNIVDFVGVSTANIKALTSDWTEGKVIDFFKSLGSQEDGVKSLIISNLIKKGYKKENILMVGDANGDYIAAMDNNIKYFPMIPGQEDDSWLELDNAIEKLMNHNFDEEYQEKLLENYNKALM